MANNYEEQDGNERPEVHCSRQHKSGRLGVCLPVCAPRGTFWKCLLVKKKVWWRR